jgi:two-component system sensor histidine kinase PilS (NtrC family)
MRDETGHERFLGVRTTVLDRPEPTVTAVFQDITDTKQIEDLMLRAERLQAVAELGASLAHEIKNPLASIRSAVEQLASTARLNEGDRTVLRRLVITESDRLSRLLAEFMEFSRIELRRWGAVDLCKVTRDAIQLVQQHPDAGRAGIELHAPKDPLIVTGDEDLLHRAVFNLVLNAVQHSREMGRVKVELDRLGRTQVPSSVPIDQPVRLAVTDNGPGIAPDAVGRIFDPFFTTREGGTGLGLALVHRAVEAHQGMILVDGGPEMGAQFTVYLPGPAEKRT